MLEYKVRPAAVFDPVIHLRAIIGKISTKERPFKLLNPIKYSSTCVYFKMFVTSSEVRRPIHEICR